MITARFFACGALLAVGCSSNSPPEAVPTVPVSSIPGHETMNVDTTPKQSPRLMPAETLMRSYLSIFGGLAASSTQTPSLALQSALQGTQGADVFDTWDTYLITLGMPDYANEIARGSQLNALMLATFERIGIALCDRAAVHDLGGTGTQVVFTFSLPSAPFTGTTPPTEFTSRLDTLHQRFLGYPLAMAPAERAGRFFNVYQQVVAQGLPPHSSFANPAQAGWASVCYGLVRHPEFHLY